MLICRSSFSTAGSCKIQDVEVCQISSQTIFLESSHSDSDEQLKRHRANDVFLHFNAGV